MMFTLVFAIVFILFALEFAHTVREPQKARKAPKQNRKDKYARLPGEPFMDAVRRIKAEEERK